MGNVIELRVKKPTTYSDLRHVGAIKRIVSSFHESWMSEDDKLELENMLIHEHGRQIDNAIQEGIDKGYSSEFQEKLAVDLIARLKWR